MFFGNLPTRSLVGSRLELLGNNATYSSTIRWFPSQIIPCWLQQSSSTPISILSVKTSQSVWAAVCCGNRSRSSIDSICEGTSEDLHCSLQCFLYSYLALRHHLSIEKIKKEMEPYKTKAKGWHSCCTSKHQETIKHQEALLRDVPNLSTGLVTLENGKDFINTVLIDNSLNTDKDAGKTLVIAHGFILI
jgi:hypothetical protein